MRIIFGAVLIAFCLSMFAFYVQAGELAQAIIPAVQAPQQKLAPLAGGIEGRISLDLRNIEINDALKYFALKTGLNIVSTKSVKGRVTLVVDGVRAKDVFDIMLRANGLAYDKSGDIYNVMTEEEYAALYGKKFSDTRQIKVFRLEYAIPDQVFSFLDTLKSSIGRILVDPESGTVLCMDSPDNLAMMEAALKKFEQESLMKVFTLNYAKAKDVEEQLKSRLDGKKVGSIQADERANQVIVQALPRRMEEIEKLIKALDKKTLETLIDTKVVKVKLGDGTDEGVRWEGLFDASEKNGLTYIGSTPFASVSSASADWRSRKQAWQDTGYVGSYPFSGTTSNYSSGSPTIGLDSLHIGIVGSNDFDTVINYLRTENEAKILSNPKIAVVNNQEARIHVGAREAYVTTTTTTGTSTSTISEQVNFIDIGIQMSVTPTINDEGFISLKLKTEISSVIDTLVTPTGNKIPIVDTSLAETTVLVKAGSTLVIGGLRREEKGKTVRRVPIFSKIPVLGKLFQTKSESKDTTELLILITPTLISGEALVSESGMEIGEHNIKPAVEYKELTEKKEQLKVLKPADAEFGGMELKGLRPYND